MPFCIQWFSDTSMVKGGGTASPCRIRPSMHNDFARQDAVFEGVHFGDGAASQRFGAGGFLGIAPVGFDLLWGHGLGHGLNDVLVRQYFGWSKRARTTEADGR
jgi:hypothetical protein